MVNVEFEWFDPQEIDFHGLKTLLRQLLDLDNQLFDLSALADLILSLRSMGALAIAFLCFLCFLVGAGVLTGFAFLVWRFVEWTRHGPATGGAIVLMIASSVIIATGVAVFLRLTDPRRTR